MQTVRMAIHTAFFVRMNQHSTCFLLQWCILTLIMEVEQE